MSMRNGGDGGGGVCVCGIWFVYTKGKRHHRQNTCLLSLRREIKIGCAPETKRVANVRCLRHYTAHTKHGNSTSHLHFIH